MLIQTAFQIQGKVFTRKQYIEILRADAIAWSDQERWLFGMYRSTILWLGGIK